VACTQSSLPTSEDLTADISSHHELSFSAHLVSSDVLHTDVLHTTDVHGEAVFHLTGSTVHFQVTLHDVGTFEASHIHLSTTGDVVVSLHGTVQTDASHHDILLTGQFHASDFLHELAGHPLSDLISAFHSGTAIVDVHTTDVLHTTTSEFHGTITDVHLNH